MQNDTNTTTPIVAVPTPEQAVSSAPARGFDQRGANRRGPAGQGGQGGRRGGPGGGANRRGGREARPRPEFDQKIIDIRRVARVAAGGRRFNFSVCVVIGDRKGSVGVGTGKAGDTSLAIDKAVKSARKSMVKLHLTKTNSIPREVTEKYSSARIMILPSKGRGLVAGSALRTVLELAGIKDVTAKILSPSKNKLNIARAAVSALSQINVARPR
jgi:small subunit ribosomal protein S5